MKQWMLIIFIAGAVLPVSARGSRETPPSETPYTSQAYGAPFSVVETAAGLEISLQSRGEDWAVYYPESIEQEAYNWQPAANQNRGLEYASVSDTAALELKGNSSIQILDTPQRQLMLGINLPEDTYVCIYRPEDRSILLRLPGFTEFFPGEAELFARVSGYTYEEMAIGLLQTMLWRGGGSSLALPPVPAGIRVYTGWYSWVKDQHLHALRQELSRRLPVSAGQWLELGSRAADALYGPNVSPYIRYYFKVLQQNHHPPLANTLRNRIDPAEMREITPEEGIAVAMAGMRYLSWGVDYTPYPGRNLVMHDTSAYIEQVDAWISNHTGSLSSDYLPYPPYEINSNEESRYNTPQSPDSHVPNSDRAVLYPGYLDSHIGIQVTGRNNDAHVQRIDLWSAVPYGWPGSGEIRIKTIVCTGTGSSSATENPDQDFPVYIRENPESSTYKLGIELNEQAPLGGIMVMVDPVSGPGGNPHTFAIEIRSPDGEWKPVPEESVIEIAYDSLAGDYGLQLPDERSPAGLRSGRYLGRYLQQSALHFSKNRENLVPVYYILTEPVSGTGIRITETSASAYVLHEIAAFDADPLCFLTAPGRTIVMPGDYIYKVQVDGDARPGLIPTITTDYGISPKSSGYPGGETVTLEIDLHTSVPLRTAVIRGDGILSAAACSADPAMEPDGIGFQTHEIPGNLLSTPFGSNGIPQRGNPLPYVRGGVDSPRVYAWKMAQQSKSRDSISNRGTGSGYLERYVTEPMVLQHAGIAGTVQTDALGRYLQNPYGSVDIAQLHRPFLPGLMLTPWHLEDKRTGITQLDKTAGVDSIGLLLGSLAMAGIEHITDTSGRQVLENMAQYLSLQKPGPGRDANGAPVFYAYADEIPSIIELGIHMSPMDLERHSVIIPDLQSLRPGDILVDTQEDGRLHIALVVAVDLQFPGSSQENAYREMLENITVLSVGRGLTAVSVGSWSKLLPDPLNYHARRIVFPDNPIPPSEDFSVPEWDPLVQRISGLAVKLTSSQSQDWIDVPNTGLPHVLGGPIHITPTPAHGGVSIIERNIALLSPVDPYYFDQPPGSSGSVNIWRNSGSGLRFGVMLPASNGPRFLEIAAYMPDQYSTNTVYIDGKAQSIPYTVRPNPELFSGTWEGIAGARLYIAEDTSVSGPEGDKNSGVLRFEHPQYGGSCEFAFAAPRESHTGDDFQIGFALVPEDDDFSTRIHGYTALHQLISIIDAKALWRAHAYLGNSPQLSRYHWEQDAWGGRNAWLDELRADGSIGEFETSINIGSYTWISDNVQSGAVGYDYDGSDTPQGFLRKLDSIRSLHQYYGIQEQTEAPETEWSSYLREIQALSIQTGKNPSELEVLYGPVIDTDPDVLPWALSQVPIGGGYPYVPGWTEYLRRSDRFPDDLLLGKYGAGVDCVSMVQHAYGYTGTPYRWTQQHLLHEHYDWTSSQSQPRRYPYHHNENRGLAEVIASYDDVEPVVIKGIDKFIPKNLHLIRPGDVVYYPGHLMMVQNVEIPQDINLLQPHHIRLIESTWLDPDSDDFRGSVMIARHIGSIAEKNWVVLRLRQN